MANELPVGLEEIKQLEHMLQQKYMAFLRDRAFSISCGIDVDKKTALATVTLENKAQTFVYPIEGFINYAAEEIEPREGVLFLIDYIDLYFDEFFDANEELYIPIDWARFEYDATEFFLRGQILNKAAEAMADRILSQDNDFLN